jgi:UDPglucose 6-dehydrogenase
MVHSVEGRRIVVVGAGYVGLVTAAGFARLKHHVTLVESRPDRLNALRQGHVPIHEAGLEDAIGDARTAGLLDVGETIPNRDQDWVMVCVGTPIGEGGRSDLSQVYAALEQIEPLAADGAAVVIRSTMPIGTTEHVVARTRLDRSRVFTNPEFLRQGTALNDFLHPSRIVIGTFPEADPGAVAEVVALFGPLGAETLTVSMSEAELIKNGSNAFLALKLSFTNELALLAESAEADAAVVIDGITRDPRIGTAYMRPGFGFGGSCLPKELQTVALAGTARGLEMHVTTAAASANEAHQRRFATRIATILGGVSGRRIAMLGMAFKAGTDDIRMSPAVRVADLLSLGGADVRTFDPEAAENVRRERPEYATCNHVEEALHRADAAVVATEWPEFRDIDWPAMLNTMARPLVIDGRRLLDGEKLRELGFEYHALGLGEPSSVPART